MGFQVGLAGAAGGFLWTSLILRDPHHAQHIFGLPGAPDSFTAWFFAFSAAAYFLAEPLVYLARTIGLSVVSALASLVFIGVAPFAGAVLLCAGGGMILEGEGPALLSIFMLCGGIPGILVLFFAVPDSGTAPSDAARAVNDGKGKSVSGNLGWNALPFVLRSAAISVGMFCIFAGLYVAGSIAERMLREHLGRSRLVHVHELTDWLIANASFIAILTGSLGILLAALTAGPVIYDIVVNRRMLLARRDALRELNEADEKTILRAWALISGMAERRDWRSWHLPAATLAIALMLGVPGLFLFLGSCEALGAGAPHCTLAEVGQPWLFWKSGVDFTVLPVMAAGLCAFPVVATWIAGVLPGRGGWFLWNGFEGDEARIKRHIEILVRTGKLKQTDNIDPPKLLAACYWQSIELVTWAFWLFALVSAIVYVAEARSYWAISASGVYIQRIEERHPRIYGLPEVVRVELECAMHKASPDFRYRLVLPKADEIVVTQQVKIQAEMSRLLELDAFLRELKTDFTFATSDAARPLFEEECVEAVGKGYPLMPRAEVERILHLDDWRALR